MSINEIKALPAKEIERQVQKKGVYLNTYQEPKFFIDIYKLDACLIEIYTHHR